MSISLKLADEKGIGIIEVIAALGVALIVITALVSLSVYTLRSSTQSKLFLKGSKKANEQMELVRAYRDGSPNWTTFVNDLMSNACDYGGGGAYTAQCYMEYNGAVLSVNHVSAGANCENYNTPEELCWSFAVSAEDGSVDPDDTVIRIVVETRWKIGAEEKTSYIYSDVSNWRAR